MRIFISKAIKFFAALLLLPTAPALIMGLRTRASSLGERTLFLENPLSLCLAGILLWGIFSLLFRLPSSIYVFAHEWTHALFVKLCGGQVKKISVRANRGYVISDKSNFLIVLAPYLFPFYAALWGGIGCFSAMGMPFVKFQIPFWIGMGICLGYHWTMTAKMMTMRQTDFSSQGYFFSFVLIIWVNLILMLLLLLLLPSPTGWSQNLSHVIKTIARDYAWLYHQALRFLAR